MRGERVVVVIARCIVFLPVVYRVSSYFISFCLEASIFCTCESVAFIHGLF